MAIQIRAHLTASPNPTTLPRRIDFRQTLRSNLNGGENAVVVYQMNPGHDIWFKDSDDNLTKTIQRTLQECVIPTADMNSWGFYPIGDPPGVKV